VRLRRASIGGVRLRDSLENPKPALGNARESKGRSN